ncbi:MAG: cysteine--tRNA ligase, partial [Actinomycetota bacterium]|nr:cysteine--tRNA ligase [Actinomycetota bacterium]
TKCESIWYRAMDAIGVLRPDDDPHATVYVEQMVELIGRLVDDDKAYVTSDGVYFAVESVDDYGLLARQSLESLKAGARIEVAEEKRSPVDFALWKFAKPGEPTWDSPWGPGRPGWHTECVVMSLDLLGEGFDIHGGGQDLAFPHHENERAQAVGVGQTFARHWVHNGFVEMGGEKMSKSLGNTMNLLDLIDSADPRAYRLLVLQSHYRSPVEVTEATVARAVATLERLDTFARRTSGLDPAEPDAEAVARFKALMDDDMNTPGAMDQLFRLVREGNTALDMEDEAGAAVAWATAATICEAVGLELDAAEPEGPDERILGLMVERDQARAAKDFARADALRDEIAAAGWIVEDTAQGTAVRAR